MIPIFTATGLLLFYCACIPVKFALCIRFNGHTTLGAAISIFEGRYAQKAAYLRASGEKKRLPWKKTGLNLEKKHALAAAMRSAKHLLAHARLEQLRLEGSLSLPDAAQTAILCGSLHMLQGILAPFAPMKSVHITPQADFSGRSSLILRGMICVPAGHIMLAAIIGAAQYLKSARRFPTHGKASH